MWTAVVILLCAAGMHAAPREYAGSRACAQCHARIYQRQITSNHAQALRPIRGSQLEALLTANPIGEREGYRFEYARRPDGLTVTARGANDQATGILEWAFGTGQVGMTPVGRDAEGHYFEHRVSYYAEPKRVGITPGQSMRASATATQALGLPQRGADIARCFNCHSTGMKNMQTAAGVEPDLTGMQPGVQCERCHGPGRAHVDAAASAGPKPEIRSAIVNPGRLTGRLSVELCGDCHRIPKPGHADAEPERVEPISIRFQPIGLLASRCFRESKTLNCLTCHDPHSNAVRNDPAFYSSRCMSCHQLRATHASGCPRADNSNCLSCHMRRTSPFPHFTFTDHRIRIYHP